jgi:hypothetical protein
MRRAYEFSKRTMMELDTMHIATDIDKSELVNLAIHNLFCNMQTAAQSDSNISTFVSEISKILHDSSSVDSQHNSVSETAVKLSEMFSIVPSWFEKH